MSTILYSDQYQFLVWSDKLILSAYLMRLSMSSTHCQAFWTYFQYGSSNYRIAHSYQHLFMPKPHHHYQGKWKELHSKSFTKKHIFVGNKNLRLSLRTFKRLDKPLLVAPRNDFHAIKFQFSYSLWNQNYFEVILWMLESLLETMKWVHRW